jgi:hypothetical protein
MTERHQRTGGEAQRRRLRNAAGLLASGLAHGLLLLAIVLFGSPRLFATVTPEPIVVDIVPSEEIVPPEELAKGESLETGASKEAQTQPSQQQPSQQQPSQQQPAKQKNEPQQPQAQSQPQQWAQSPSPVRVASAAPAAAATSVAPATPVFTSLYPWPQARPANDVQQGDYRTFESTGKLDHNGLAQFKSRLKECWHPPLAGGGRKLAAALRVALRTDGSLAGPPELVEVSASPDAVALVTSAKQALVECGPYGFLPAENYDTWKALSLTFSPDDIGVAAVMR